MAWLSRQAPEQDSSYQAVPKRVRLRVSRFMAERSTLGILLAMFAYSQSLTPSLLPREWFAQGVVSGLSIAAAYLLGTSIAHAAAALELTSDRVVARLARFRIWMGWIGLASLPLLLLWSVRDRQAEWSALGYDVGDRFLYSGVLLVVVLIVAVSGVLAWASHWLYRRFLWGTSKVLPALVAGVTAATLTATAIFMAVNEFAYSRFLNGLNDTVASQDVEVDESDPGPDPSRFKTAGATSNVSWESLGREGRRFILRSPTRADIARFSGREAREPVRVFIGRHSAGGVHERAELAMVELERTGGFQRDVLLMVTPTGTGWVNEQIVQPVEYFHDGNTATVAVQYSHLPSPMAFLAEREAAVESSRAVFAAILARLASIEPDQRPALLVAGESLGSFGAQAVFANLDDMIRRVDGALWVGPPPMAHLRREAEARRDSGSYQIRPVISSLPEVIFGARATDFVGTGGRYGFLQQADDPIVWWDTSLLYSRPDWLREPLDPQVSTRLRWRPVTTYLQLTADMIVGNNFAEGLGHRYGTMPLTAWYEMLDPPGWTREMADSLRQHLDELAGSLR